MRVVQPCTLPPYRGEKIHNLVGKHCIMVDRFHDTRRLKRLRVKHWVPDVRPGDILIFCPWRAIEPIGHGELRNLGHYIVLNQQALHGGLHYAEVGKWIPDVTIAGETHSVPLDFQYPPERVTLINIRSTS